MRNNFYICICTLLLLGCTTKEEKSLMKHYNKEIQYHKQLLKTEKIQLYDENITKVMLTATYLHKNNLKTKNNSNENFIVGIYADETTEPFFLTNSEYTLRLNGHLPKKIKLLKKGDKLLKNISFVSEWSSFYFVEFPHIAKDSLTLKLNSPMYGKGSLHFAKVAKYTLHKKVY